MPDAEPVASLVDLLHRASRCADAVFTRQVGDVTPRQFLVLSVVAASSGLSQTAIMAATGLDRSSTAELVGRLVAKGWLQRRRTRHDGRAYAVRLTARGRDRLATAGTTARAVDQSLAQLVPAKERRVLLAALHLIASRR